MTAPWSRSAKRLMGALDSHRTAFGVGVAIRFAVRARLDPDADSDTDPEEGEQERPEERYDDLDAHSHRCHGRARAFERQGAACTVADLGTYALLRLTADAGR